MLARVNELIQKYEARYNLVLFRPGLFKQVPFVDVCFLRGQPLQIKLASNSTATEEVPDLVSWLSQQQPIL